MVHAYDPSRRGLGMVFIDHYTGDKGSEDDNGADEDGSGNDGNDDRGAVSVGSNDGGADLGPDGDILHLEGMRTWVERYS